MKNKAFKIVLALLFMFGITALAVTFASPKVYAEEIVDSLGEDEETTTEEPEETTEEEQQEEVALTEEEKSKLDKVIEWLSTLDKEELFAYLNAAKSWLVAGGIITVISFLAAIVGLIASMLKLSREKVKNSELSEENKKKILDLTATFEKKLVEGNNQIKALLLEFVNNMSDEDKKAMEANINDVKAKIEQALETAKQE